MPIGNVTHYANCGGLITSCDTNVNFVLPGSSNPVGADALMQKMGAALTKQVDVELRGCYDFHGLEYRSVDFSGSKPADVKARQRKMELLAPIVQAVIDQPHLPENGQRLSNAVAGKFPEGLVDQYIASLPMIVQGQVTRREQCLPREGSGGSAYGHAGHPSAPARDGGGGGAPKAANALTARARGPYTIGDKNWDCQPKMSKTGIVDTDSHCTASEWDLKHYLTRSTTPQPIDPDKPVAEWMKAQWVQKNICSVAPHLKPYKCGLQKPPVITTTYSENLGIQGKELYLKSLYEKAEAFDEEMWKSIRIKNPKFDAMCQGIFESMEKKLYLAGEPRRHSLRDVKILVYVVAKSAAEKGKNSPDRETSEEAMNRLVQKVADGRWSFADTVVKHIETRIDPRYVE